MLSKTFIAFFLLVQTSLYNLEIKDVGGNEIQLSAYQGKKILFVNIATSGPYAVQLQGLKQLQQQFADSLVVIAFPSNSFGNETRTNNEIRQFCQSQGVNFLVSEKTEVTGPNMHAVYKWLTLKAENGVMDQDIKTDFQKYLVNGQGQIIGVFAGVVQPTDPEITNAINQN